MRLLMTSLGSWDTIESGQRKKHSITFPLAILGAVLEDAGLPAADVWEGDDRPAGPWDALLVSAMDSRHFWRVAGFLQDVGCPVLSSERGERDPFVVMGGQAATAPAPVEEMVDVVFVGEAEAGAARLLEALAGEGSRAERLQRAADLPGCYVPALHWGTGHVTQQVWATDISLSLNERLWVNHRKIHRVEIARGCRSKCGFCALGWRSPYRENSEQAITEALARTKAMGVREVHLSAGDAEAHSAIRKLRRAVANMSLRDHGWTGRLDTMEDCSVSAGKYFAFGIEGCSHRLRRIAGKPKLTDGYVLDQMEAYWDAGGRRGMWHLIGGLPSEGPDDHAAFDALLGELGDRARGHEARIVLEIGRQPFGPLPHTPMQWFRPGITTEAIGEAIKRNVGAGGLTLKDKTGQPVSEALINTLVMRGGREVAELVRQGKPSLPRDPRQARMRFLGLCRRHGLRAERYLSDWSPYEPTPWAHIRSAFPLEALQRAHASLRRKAGLAEVH